MNKIIWSPSGTCTSRNTVIRKPARVLPWTRLHALKDYWGMVKILEEFPKFHATFNVVPAPGTLEEYASGTFTEPWFERRFATPRSF
jgi:alpha-amylase/alpha-mannosidase (GH57 family)